MLQDKDMTIEDQLRRALRHRLDDLGETQIALGRRLSPESKNPGAAINQYIGRTPTRALLTGKALELLEALGAEEIEIKWKKQP